MSHINMAVKAIKRKDKEAKAKKETRVKKQVKAKDRSRSIYDYYERVTRIYHSINYKKPSNYKFIPYTGARWKIPSGIPVTESVKYKFEKLETFKITEVFRELKKESSNNFFTNNSYCSYDSDFYKMPLVKSYLTNLKARNMNEWKQVSLIYSALFRVVRFMNKLVCLRRLHLCMKKQINTEDIATMEIPKKPVYVINYPERCTYVYEADTLRKSINTRLLMSDWMFETPQYPVNPLSNEPFTTGQLLSIYNQMKSYGSFSWIFDRFKACTFNLKLYKLRFKQQLKLEAIESHFKNEYVNSRETIFDFFETNAIIQGLSDNNIEKFKTFYTLYPNSIYTIKLKAIVMRYYIALELNDLPTLNHSSYEIKTIIQRYLNGI